MYVPVLQTVEALLKNRVVISEVSCNFLNIYTNTCMCRLNMDIKLLPVFFMIIVTEKVLQLTHSSRYRVMPCKYSCTLMSWRFVIPWDLRSKFINWVCMFLFIMYAM